MPELYAFGLLTQENIPNVSSASSVRANSKIITSLESLSIISDVMLRKRNAINGEARKHRRLMRTDFTVTGSLVESYVGLGTQTYQIIVSVRRFKKNRNLSRLISNLSRLKKKYPVGQSSFL